MRDHVKILGILNIAMGCLSAVAGLIVLLIFGGLAGVVGVSATDQDAAVAAPVIAIVGVCIAIFLLVLGLPAIVGGWGLLKFKPWAKILVLILSVLHLFHIPLGTALGIYGLWVLLNDETRRLFETGGQVYVPPVPQSPPSYPASPTYPPPPPPGV